MRVKIQKTNLRSCSTAKVDAVPVDSATDANIAVEEGTTYARLYDKAEPHLGMMVSQTATKSPPQVTGALSWVCLGVRFL